MPSQIKTVAINTLHRIDSLVKPKITNPVIAYFWNRFFIPYGTSILNKISDEELKTSYKDAYSELKPLFEQAQVSHQLIEARKLNDEVIIKKLMKLPDFEKAMELVDNVL